MSIHTCLMAQNELINLTANISVLLPSDAVHLALRFKVVSDLEDEVEMVREAVHET